MTPEPTRRQAVMTPLAAALAAAAAWLGGCASLVVPRSIEVPQERLQEALAARFPIVRRVADGIELTIAVPRLTMRPEENRVAVECEVSGGAGLLGRPIVGVLAISHGLVFDAADSSIKPLAVRVERLHLDGLPAGIERGVERLARPVAEVWLAQLPLYVLKPRDLERLQAAGVEPGQIRITATGIVIELRPRSAAA